MKRRIASLTACLVLFGASGAFGGDSTVIMFMLEKGEYCETSGGTTGTVTFVDTGADTATQTGTLELVCTGLTTPVVTVTGGDVATPPDDFAGTMTGGGSDIPFTGAFTATPSGAGMTTPIQWTFSATATGISGATSGSYSKILTFTVTP